MAVAHVGEDGLPHVPLADDPAGEGHVVRPLGPRPLRGLDLGEGGQPRSGGVRACGAGGVRIDAGLAQLVGLDPALFLQFGELEVHRSLGVRRPGRTGGGDVRSRTQTPGAFGGRPA